MVWYCGGVVPANGPKGKHGNLRMKKKGKIKYRELNAFFLVSGDAGDVSCESRRRFCGGFNSSPGDGAGVLCFAVQCVLSGAEGTTDGYLSWMIESRTFFWVFSFFFSLW